MKKPLASTEHCVTDTTLNCSHETPRSCVLCGGSALQTETVSEQLCWYAIYTKAGEEDRAESNLKACQIETFTPRVKVRRIDKNTNKPTFVVKPLFARYLFARFKASQAFRKVCFTRGVQSVVSFGGQLSPVDDEIIELIQLQRDENDFVRITERLNAGDRVLIKEGALKNLAGIFEGTVKERDRISILLTAISYQSRVVIDRAAVRKIA